MLKRNWKNNWLFCHIFDVGEISIGGACPSSPCLRLCSKWGKQRRCSQIFREVSVVFQRNFNCSKNSAVLEPRTGQFLRTWGFEAKDLRLRGQGKGLQNVSWRPRTSSKTPPLNNIANYYYYLRKWHRWLSKSNYKKPDFTFFTQLHV